MPGDQVLWWSKEVHRIFVELPGQVGSWDTDEGYFEWNFMVFAASCVAEERASAGVWDLAQDEREDVTRNLF
jgi:hypothetical protein